MVDVFEFIKEKRADLKDNTDRYRVMIEPKFKALSQKLNSSISNTLNNPWMLNLPSIDKSNIFKKREPISNENIKKAYDKIKNRVGEEILVGQWETVNQDQINRFADLTGDNQWIHTDVEKAKIESPFKSTIAHGFLTLSLIPKLTENFDFESIHPGLKMIVNCGLNQVRFPYPVKSGSKIRGRVKIVNLIPKRNNIELVNEVSIEVEGRKRFGCVAETVLRLYY
ncbi:MaoC family dehydratase [bacterium]|jgi:acyl dehydratase|nr:MaoC family dehydratase [bacterium]MDG1223906.1 MaoC family dehydratase [Candidatus Neomarinimicrobiota bacterium]MBT4249746.1 MaoC family dehydratase [bacterium]MBT4927162.1 MaoC family dehydratase [bacterium]MBT6018312.1 MaoC family dehydratase [bacterium]